MVTTPGVDLVTVLKYALMAHRRQVIRDIALLVLLCALIASVLLSGSAIVFLLLLVAAWVTVCVERYANSRGAARGLRPETFRPDKAHVPARNSYADRQLKRIAAASTTGNVTLYSKFPPFVGYGTVSTSWSFAVDVTKPRNRTRPRSFSVYEVYDWVARPGSASLTCPAWRSPTGFSSMAAISGTTGASSPIRTQHR